MRDIMRMVLTALLIIMQPLQAMIMSGKLAVSPMLKNTIALCVQAIERAIYFLDFAQFFG